MIKRNQSIGRGLVYRCGLSDWMFSPKERLAEATFSSRTEGSVGPHHIPQFEPSY